MIHVACAIIEQDQKVLCVQRSETMHQPLKWEFPGGKQEAGESLVHCLKREIKEELNIEIDIGQALPDQCCDNGQGESICFYPFICKIISGTIYLTEHKAMVWLPLERLESLDWAAADRLMVKTYHHFRKP